MGRHNARIIGGDDAIERLAALRAETDGTIGVGSGRPLFDDLDLPLELDLIEQRSFEQGRHDAPLRDPRCT